MIRNLTLRGPSATITWWYHTAAVVHGWAVTKNEKNEWSLTAAIDRADRFQLRQRPLYFTAPRPGGFFRWPVRAVTVGRESLTATLEKPEY